MCSYRRGYISYTVDIMLTWCGNSSGIKRELCSYGVVSVAIRWRLCLTWCEYSLDVKWDMCRYGWRLCGHKVKNITDNVNQGKSPC